MSSPFDAYLRLMGTMYSSYLPVIDRAVRLQRELPNMLPSMPASPFHHSISPAPVGESISGADKVIRPPTGAVGAERAAKSSPLALADNLPGSFQPFGPWFALAQTMLQTPLVASSASPESPRERRSDTSDRKLRPSLQAVPEPDGLDQPLSPAEQLQVRVDGLRRQVADIERQQEQFAIRPSVGSTAVMPDPAALVAQMFRTFSMLIPQAGMATTVPSADQTPVPDAEPRKRRRATPKLAKSDQKRSSKQAPAKKAKGKQGRR